MRSRIVRIILLVVAAVIVGLAVWAFWVPIRDAGGRAIAKTRVWPTRPLIWSPDSRYVQYCNCPNPALGAVETSIAAADGSHGRPLGQNVYPAGWRQNPFLPVVAEEYGEVDDRETRLFAVEPRTGKRQPLGPPFDVSNAAAYAVAPSLQQVAVLRRGKAGWEVSVVVPGGPAQEPQAFPGSGDVAGADWSPDETQLAVLTTTGIAILDLMTGSSLPLLTPAPGARGGRTYVDALAWSPNGEEIAFAVSRLGPPAKALGWAANYCLRNMAIDAQGMLKARRFFLDSRFKHIRSTVYSLRAEDGAVREMFVLPARIYVDAMAWSPEGHELALKCCTGRYPSAEAEIRIFDIPAAKSDDWRPIEEVLPGFRTGD